MPNQVLTPPLRHPLPSAYPQQHAHFRRCPSVDSAAASDIGSYAISARAHACSTVYQARGVACAGQPRTLCLARHAVGRARSRKSKQSLLGFEGCLPTTSFSECRHPGPTRRRSDRVASLRCLYAMLSRLLTRSCAPAGPIDFRIRCRSSRERRRMTFRAACASSP